jgi:HEAT repeat protein
VALKHDNKFMRKNAIVALGDIGDPAGTDALVQMMFIEFQGVSFYPEASYALFQIGPSVSQALLDLMAGKNDAVNKYFEKSGGIKDTAIKAKAGFVLGDLRDMRAVDPLIQAFEGAAKSTPPDPVVMIYSAAPLAALGDKKAVPVLKEHMMTVDASQRDPIMRSLVQLGDRTLAPDMIKAMTFADFVERCQKQFGESKENCESDDTKAALFGAQKGAADHASNLAGAEHAAAYEKVLAEEKNEEMKKYFTARLARVQAAVECKTEAACWIKKLGDKDPLVREKAAWELSWLRDPSTMDALAANLGDKDNYARSATINAYWTFGDKRAVPIIEKQLAADEGQATYIKVNQDLKRLLVALKRGA